MTEVKRCTVCGKEADNDIFVGGHGFIGYTIPRCADHDGSRKDRPMN